MGAGGGEVCKWWGVVVQIVGAGGGVGAATTTWVKGQMVLQLAARAPAESPRACDMQF